MCMEPFHSPFTASFTHLEVKQVSAGSDFVICLLKTWIFVLFKPSGGPAPSTDARPYSALGLLAARQDPSAAYLGTPVSSAALKDVIRATGYSSTI